MDAIATKSIFWSYIEKISSQTISFVVSIVLARMLMPEEYSIITAALIFINICEVIATYGLGTSLVQKKDDVDSLDYSTIFNVSLIIGIVLYLLSFAGSDLIERFYEIDSLSLVIKILALKIPLASINSIQRAICQRRLDFKKLFFSSLVGTTISAIVGIGSVYLGYGVWALVFQYLSKAVVDTIALFMIVRITIRPIISRERFRPLFKFGWKVLLTSLIIKIYDELRSLVIGKKYEQVELALFNKGSQIPVLLVSVIDSAMGSAVLPLLSREQDDVDKIKSKLSTLLRLTCFIVLPMITGLAVVAKPLIIVLLTDKWIGAVPYMWISCLTCVFLPITEIDIQAIRSCGKSGVGLANEIICKVIGVIALVLAIVFIDTPLAVATSFIVHSVSSLIVNMWACHKYLKYSVRSQLIDVLPSAVSCILMGAATFSLGYLITNSYLLLLTQFMVGIIMYLLLSLVFQSRNLHDIINLLKTLKRRT